MPKARFLPASRRKWWGGWALLALLAVGTAGYSVPVYLTGDESRSRIPINPDVALHFLYLTAHALPASLLLALGPFQFVPAWRKKYPKAHRVIGRIYMISVVCASVAAILSATFSVDGFSVQVAFYLLTAGWLYSLFQAYRTIRRGQIQLHRVWMIRNYALSFAAVVLRVFLLIGLALRSQIDWLTFDDVYSASVWSSVLISAVTAEWFIVQRMLAPLARSRRPAAERSRAATATPAQAGPGRVPA